MSNQGDQMTDYPEHDKLHKIADKSQTIGEFMDWLGEQGLFLATYSDGYYDGNIPLRISMDIPGRLAEYFDINQKALEREKIMMLGEQRRMFERQT